LQEKSKDTGLIIRYFYLVKMEHNADMEKRKPSAFDPAFDAIKLTGQLMQGKSPKVEQLVTPTMKNVAKGLGDLAIFGWSNKKK
jgi:hypothetical protein